MKSIFLIAILAITTNLLAAQANTTENERLCKVFNLKISQYKKGIREDKYAQQTLRSYEKRRDLYCKKTEK